MSDIDQLIDELIAAHSDGDREEYVALRKELINALAELLSTQEIIDLPQRLWAQADRLRHLYGHGTKSKDRKR
jgi:DNA-binding GntR family transcriptional regulator